MPLDDQTLFNQQALPIQFETNGCRVLIQALSLLRARQRVKFGQL